MKAHIFITTDDGMKYETEVDLVATGKVAKPAATKKSQTPALSHHSKHPDFALSIRNFVKTHARPMSGPQRFALLVAYATKGKTDQQVGLAQITKHWGKMTSHLGKFNPAYSTRAKDEGWVDSPKQGQYKILSNWTDIFGTS